MKAREFANSKLVIFDIDDTLVNTNTRVDVRRDGRVVRSLNSHEFTTYQLEPGEEFDFGRFRDAREFQAQARPIPGMIGQLRRDIETGNRVIMLTARADFDDRDVFLDTFRAWGIDMDQVHVYRAGNIVSRAPTEEKKAQILRRLMGQQHYDKVIMYDDSVPNLQAFLALAREYPWSRFYAWHVDPTGEAREYHRSSIREDDDHGDLPSVTRAQQAIPQILARAQQDYDAWDETDRDTYAGGGICHIIADSVCDVLSDAGIECTSVSCSHEQHVYVAARFAEGIYTIDIPYHVYEQGGGFSWKKLPDVRFEPRDVVFYRVSGDPADWRDYLDEQRTYQQISERVDPAKLRTGWQDQRQQGRWLLRAHGEDDQRLIISVHDTQDRDREVGFVRFVLAHRPQDREPFVRAGFVFVNPDQRGQGLARLMYQYANDLGQDIEPSASQTEKGQAMWRGLGKDIRRAPPAAAPAPRRSWYRRLLGRDPEPVAEGLRDITNFVRNIGSDPDAPIVMMTNPQNTGARTASGQRMRIEDFPLRTVAVSELRPWEPMIKMRDLPSQRTVASLIKTLQQGGRIPPLLVTPVRGGYRIIDGHHRYAALQRAGIEQVPVRVVDPRLIRYSDEVMEALKITLERYGHLAVKEQAEAQGEIKLGPQLFVSRQTTTEDIKPRGVAWTSTAQKTPQGFTSDWVEWCKDNMAQWVTDTGILYDVAPGARILLVRTDRDVIRVARRYGLEIKNSFDLFEKMDWDVLRQDYDAVHHIPQGRDPFMSAWDVESTAWFDRKFLTNPRRVTVDTGKTHDIGQTGKPGVAESLDQPYRIKWERSPFGDLDAIATLEDGSNLLIMFNNEADQWRVEFYRGDRQDITGEGDAQRIFATVLKAIREFIRRKKPPSIVFGSVKEIDPRGSRTRLYDRMVQRYANDLGYTLHRQQDSSHTVYRLDRQQDVAEVQLNEIVKMQPTKNSSQGMTVWAYNDAIEKKSPVVYRADDVIIFAADESLLRYIRLQDGKPVLYIGFTRFLDGYKSGTVATEMSGRGKGLAKQAYLDASDILKAPIYSDSTQTDASRLGIWDKLIQQYPDRVVGFDQKNNQNLPLSMTDRGPVVNQNQPIYVDRNKKDSAKPVAPNQRYRTRILKLLPVRQGMSEGLTETRDRMYQYIKSKVPTWPDYIVRDWLYANFARGETQGPNWSFASIGKDIPKILADAGLSVNTKWQLVPNMKFTMDMWEPTTLKRLQARAGGTSKSTDPDVHIPARDAERHATQAALAQQQGGVRKEPVIIIKTSRGYELVEGWHRTIQHFAKYPQGYMGPAYVAVASNQQGVAEGIDPNTFEELDARIIARAAKQIVPTARARRTPEGYVHVTTEDGLDLYIGAGVADGVISVNIGSGGGVTTSGAHKGAVTDIIRGVYNAAVRKYGEPDTPGELTIDHDAGHGVWQHIADKLGLRYAAVEVKESGMAEGRIINTHLWHGSRNKHEVLEPRQAIDTGGVAGSNQNAIYATSDPKVAIAMGLTTPGSDTGMFPNDPQMVLFSGKIRKGEYVYLHRLPMNGSDGKPQFVQGGNSREFHSVPGINAIKPIEIKAVPVNKYLNLIRKATREDWALRKKFMKKQGVAEGRISDLDQDLQDQQWEAVVGRVEHGVRRGEDPDSMSLALYQWATGEMFDMDEELERRGFGSVADLADHIRDHGGRYVPPEFDLGAAASLKDLERLPRRRPDDVAEATSEPDFMRGHCHVMALALLTLHPDWQLRAHIGWEDDAESDSDYRVDHVYVMAPDGTAYDCRGRFASEQELVGPDETGGAETQFIDYDISRVRADVARGELRPFSRRDLEQARAFARRLAENFADGRKPGRKGLSKRVGIPRKATLGQLEKIARSSTGERRRMAQWQLNMRRGQKKNK